MPVFNFDKELFRPLGNPLPRKDEEKPAAKDVPVKPGIVLGPDGKLRTAIPENDKAI